jgi:hypothetical protein
VTTLLKFARQKRDPHLAASLLDKAASLTEQAEALPPPRLDLCPKAPDVENARRPRLSTGTLFSTNGCIFRLGQREGHSMEHYGAIWDVAAGTFIAVSLFSGMAYIIASALH